MSAMDLVKQGLAAVDARDFAKLGSLVADDFMMEGPVPEPVGKAAFIGLLQALTAGIPDWNFNISGMSEEGDVVHLTNAISGTHTGTLNLPMLPGPVAATGKTIKLPSEPVDYVVTNGKVTRQTVGDTPGGGLAGLLQQIGVPMPG